MEVLLTAVVTFIAGAVGGMTTLLLVWWIASRQLDKLDREIEEDRRKC